LQWVRNETPVSLPGDVGQIDAILVNAEEPLKTFQAGNDDPD